MTKLTVADAADVHPYLAKVYDDHVTLSSIAHNGHRWTCESCGTDSLLCYRCSSCGSPHPGD